MGRKQRLTLAHPAVQAAKERWDAGRKHCGYTRKSELTFEQWFEIFNENRLNGEEISQIVGRKRITRERVRQIYDEYFKPAFDGQTGRERFSACLSERRREKKEQADNEIFESPVIKVIAESARKAGCRIKAGRRNSGQHIALLVNGYKCSVHNASIAWRPGKQQKRSYGHIQMTYSVLCETDAYIIYVNIIGFPEHIFVIPSSLLLQLYFTPLDSERKWLYIPLEQLPAYNNSHQRLDFWQYEGEGAWHFLQPPKK